MFLSDLFLTTSPVWVVSNFESLKSSRTFLLGLYTHLAKPMQVSLPKNRSPRYEQSLLTIGAAVIMGSAAELWQFAEPDSDISKRYQHALEVVVGYGARITVRSSDSQPFPYHRAILLDAKDCSILVASTTNWFH